MIRRTLTAAGVGTVALAGAVACGSFSEGASDATPDAGVIAEAGAGADADATTADADPSARDSGVEASASLTCLPADYYCADFETTQGTFTGNDSVCSGCTITVVSGTANRGTKALKVHLAAGNSPVMNRNVDTPALPFFVRFYVHVPVKPEATLRIMTVTTTGGNGFEIGVTTSGTLAGIVYSSPTASKAATTGVVTGAGFHCVEWAITNDTAKVFLDDAELSTITVTRTSTDAISTLGVGAFYYNVTAPATDVWYDDLVVSPVKVGCAR
jgi:hypothetical protein